MTDEANPEIQKDEDQFKGLAWDTLVTAGLDYLKLNFFPVNQVIRYFTDKLYQLFSLQFDLVAIAFINEQHKTAFEKSVITLKVIAVDNGVDSPEYLKAKENAKEALSQFVRFGDAT